MTLTVTNPNDYPVTLTGVSGDGAITSNAGAACNSATGVTFTDQTGLSQSDPRQQRRHADHAQQRRQDGHELG